jgi:hypothetical protein
MVNQYFDTLLARYLAVYVRPQDPVLHVQPRHASLAQAMGSKRAVVPSEWAEAAAEPPAATDGAAAAGEPPAYFLLYGNVHVAPDLLDLLAQLRGQCTRQTRLLLVYYNWLWQPLVQLVALLRLRERTPFTTWPSPGDVEHLARLAGFEVVTQDRRVLLPVYVPLLSPFVNRWLAPLPLLRRLTLLRIALLRPVGDQAGWQPAPRGEATSERAAPSVSIVVPARNEAGTIENLIRRVPRMGPRDELILVEGHSQDDTWEEIQRCQAAYARSHTIRSARQDGVGKADAVYKGFALAINNLLLILDADLSVPPEELPRFYAAFTGGTGEFLNGNRLFYARERGAMSFLNLLANRFFAAALSYVLGQRVGDTLCGTKVLSRQAYERIQERRGDFGDLDPFGDFDLLVGAARLGLKIVDVPVHYRARTYGRTNIRRWSHGLRLLRLLLVAAGKIRFV